MKFVIAVTLVAAVFYASAEDKAEGRPKTMQRLIPADVLRDFPGKCFASTRCEKIEPGSSWPLAPYCGRSTCVAAEDNTRILLELIEDCGPLPIPNAKCKLSDKTNKEAIFPDCCPIFECEEGAILEYPEIPIITPLPAIGKVEIAEKTAPPTTPKA